MIIMYSSWKWCKNALERIFAFLMYMNSDLCAFRWNRENVRLWKNEENA